MILLPVILCQNRSLRRVKEDGKYFFSYVSPLTIISSLLAILFAVLGLWASGAVGDLDPDKIKLLDGKAYMDIAKIFAGAIVGSATASAASAIKRGKK
jgi:hypothetical protein